MNWVDGVRGTGNVLAIMVFAGLIAFVGDRVGHQVGRKRLTLFNIRPRYTSTIVAISTGMVIALIVTLGAILASEQVKTAFFKLSSINQQISQLQTQEKELEKKVNNGHLVIPTGVPVAPFDQVLFSGDSAQQRDARVKQYYRSVVEYVNRAYPPRGLKPFVAPANADLLLEKFSGDLKMQAMLSSGDVMIIATSDQNLYANDQIHFTIGATPDTRKFKRGEPIAQLVIPRGNKANFNLAELQLTSYVAAAARQAGLPDYFASNVQPAQWIPGPDQMQQMLSSQHEYVMTAYAWVDIYPHTGGIPIAIALAPAPAK